MKAPYIKPLKWQCIYCFVLLLTMTGVAIASDQEPMSVAIMPFEVILDHNKELVGLDRAISEMLITDLSKVRDLQIVERSRLGDVLKELNLPAEGFVDPKTAGTIGKGVGARAILTGSLFVNGDQLCINARLVHVESGKVLVAEKISGSIKDPFELEKQLQQKLIESLGIRLSELEKADLSVKPTHNSKAAAAYGRAEVLQETGNLVDARKEVNAALSLDPEFVVARKLATRIDTLLKDSEGEEFRQAVARIAQFESSIITWPSRQSALEIGTCNLFFNPDEDYRAACEQGDSKRALFLWVSSFRAKTGMKDFYGVLFNDPGQHGICDDYTSVGADKLNLFWCDVFASDPEFVPSHPITSEDLAVNLTANLRECYRSRCYKNYLTILELKFAALLNLGNLVAAASTAETQMHLYKGVAINNNSEVPGKRNLQHIKEVLSDPQKLRETYSNRNVSVQRWKIAEAMIVQQLAPEQFEMIHDGRLAEPENLKKMLAEQSPENRFALVGGKVLLSQYKTGMAELPAPWGAAPMTERQKMKIANERHDEMLKTAAGTPFLLVNAETASQPVEIHIAGCPYAWHDQQRPNVFGGTNPLAVRNTDYQGVQDISAAIGKGGIPCLHCRPQRWMARESLLKVLHTAFPLALVDVNNNAKNLGASAAARLRNLCILSATVSDAEVLQYVRTIVTEFALRGLHERSLQQAAVLALAGSPDPRDIDLLEKVLLGSATPDVRMFAATALSTIPNDRANQVLLNAELKEQYYFVRHWITAARQIRGKSNLSP